MAEGEEQLHPCVLPGLRLVLDSVGVVETPNPCPPFLCQGLHKWNWGGCWGELRELREGVETLNPPWIWKWDPLVECGFVPLTLPKERKESFDKSIFLG